MLAQDVTVKAQTGQDLDQHEQVHHEVRESCQGIVADTRLGRKTQEKVVLEHVTEPAPLIAVDRDEGGPTRPEVALEAVLVYR
jgi:hypothetical protein